MVSAGEARSRWGAVLAGIERRPVLSILVVAVAVRALAAVVIFVGWGGSLFLDDASYSRLAELAAEGAITDPYLDFLYERTATLLVPIVGLYELFGTIELLGQLYVVLLGAAAAALTTRLAMEIVAVRWALLAGLIVALLPSQILWSSLILKDAAVWAVLTALAVVVTVAMRSSGRRLLLMGATAVALLALLGFLRLHTLEIACVAIVLAVLVNPGPRPLARLAGAGLLLAFVPLAFGMGVAGSTFVADSVDPAEQRARNAALADSAVVDAPPTTPAAPPATQTGEPTREADGEPEANSPPTKPAPEPAAIEATAPQDDSSLEYLPTGITVVALRPWPWESSSRSVGIRLARLETIVWYPLVVLALIGLSTAWRNRRVLAFPVLAGGAILATYALTEGNLGTAYRHRGEFVWVIALLAALGAERVVAWRRRPRPSVEPAQPRLVRGST